MLSIRLLHSPKFFMPRHFFSTSTRQRQLLLLALDWAKPKDPPISLGHASIYTNLVKNGINAISKSWVVNSPIFSNKAVIDFIMERANPNVDLAMGAFVWNEASIQFILKAIRRNFPGRIILGGPQISYVKNNLELYYPEVDIFIRGYSEHALVEVMQHFNKKTIKGVHYASEPDLGTSANVELESLYSPYLTGVVKPQTFIRWETQRGCPFRCSFCQHREPQILGRRHFDLERVLKEAHLFASNPIIRDIHVVDATFNSGPNYISVLKALSDAKFHGKIALQTRIEMVKPEFLDAVEKLNETGMVVLEFGLQTIHPEEQQLIERANNVRKIRLILAEVKRRNIESEVSLIFGLPGQTVSSFQKSIDFCIRHEVPVIKAFPLMLLRGTSLFDRKKSLGLIESTEIADEKIDRVQEDIPHVVASPSFSYSEWKQKAGMSAALEVTNKIYIAKRDKKYASNVSSVAGLIKESVIFSEKNNISNTTSDTLPFQAKNLQL